MGASFRRSCCQADGDFGSRSLAAGGLTGRLVRRACLFALLGSHDACIAAFIVHCCRSLIAHIHNSTLLHFTSFNSRSRCLRSAAQLTLRQLQLQLQLQ